MFTISFIIPALFFQNILAGTVLLKMIYGKNSFVPILFHVFLPGDYSNLPGEISKDVSAQFLRRNRHGDSRCDSDQKYCESHRVSCMVGLHKLLRCFKYVLIRYFSPIYLKMRHNYCSCNNTV